MFSSLVRRPLVSQLGKVAVFGRPGTVQKAGLISGPPKVRMPLWEKFTHGTLIVVGICAAPLYILSQIHNYRGEGPAADS